MFFFEIAYRYFLIRKHYYSPPLPPLKYIYLKDSIAFLIAQQQESGAFMERGEVLHKAMQGGAAEGGYSLTAYVLIVLLQNHVQNK